MKALRSILRILIALGILLWCVGLVMGPGFKQIWEYAGYGIYVAGGAFLLILLSLPFGNLGPETKTKARQCRDCSRPAIYGSFFCAYHDKIRRTEREEKMGRG